MRRRLRLRLSLKITLMVTTFLVVTYLIVTPIISKAVTENAKRSLVDQSKSFANLSSRPIGDTYTLYRDSGLTKLRQAIQEIIETDTVISNIIIADVSGDIVYRHFGDSGDVDDIEAASFSPIYQSDKDGFISQVVYPFLEQSGAHRYTMIYLINSAEVKATLNNLQNNILFISTAVTVLAGSLLIIFIELLFVRPLKRMTQLAAAISVGDYGQSVELKSRDEINQLGNALNTMSARLKEDIEVLKRAESMKSEFLIVSSHNLRTPLTVITGYLDLLRDMPLDPQATEYLATIEEYAKQLTDLTNDMLVVAELEGHDKPTVTLEAVNITDLITQLRPAFEQHVAKKAQVLDVAIGEAPITAKVQPTYLQSVLWNLLDNASKFTPQKGLLSLSLQSDEREARIIMKDTGIGISEVEKARLFTKFHRGTSVMQYEYEGIGLGLYMTKLMLGYMGASITFESQEGQGSTFTVHVPLRQAAKEDPVGFTPVSRSGEIKNTPPIPAS